MFLLSIGRQSRGCERMIGQLTIRRARLFVLRDPTIKAGRARWSGMTPEQRREEMAAVLAAKPRKSIGSHRGNSCTLRRPHRPAGGR
jgi:hypothetical protein